MTFLKAWIVYKHGGFQLELVSISQAINHMTGYKSALIGWNYSIQTGEQILYMIFFFTNKFSTDESAQIYNRSCDLSPGFYLQLKTICVLLKPPIFSSKKKIILIWGFCDALSMFIIFTYLCTLFRNIDYPRLCYYPCLLARCPANNAKEENVKLIEISFVSWFSSLLGQVW